MSTTISANTRSNEHLPRYVVACVDGSPDGERAVRYAVSEARRRQLGLRIIHVQAQALTLAPTLSIVSPDVLHEVAADIIKRAAQQAHEYGWSGSEIDLVLAEGSRRDTILAHSSDASCVVVGRRSSTLGHLLSGSTTASLAAHADVPVISVPDTWDPATRHGVVTVGVEDCGCVQGHDVVSAAFAEAHRRQASVELMHAWRPETAYDSAIGTRVLQDAWTSTTLRSLEEQVHEANPPRDVNWASSARFERPEIVLHRASSHADLIVIGRHGHDSLVHRSLGATARTVLRTAECPVLVVPTTHHTR